MAASRNYARVKSLKRVTLCPTVPYNCMAQALYLQHKLSAVNKSQQSAVEAACAAAMALRVARHNQNLVSAGLESGVWVDE